MCKCLHSHVLGHHVSKCFARTLTWHLFIFLINNIIKYAVKFRGSWVTFLLYHFYGLVGEDVGIDSV